MSAATQLEPDAIDVTLSVCTTCNVEFPPKTALDGQVFDQSDVTVFKCPLCDGAFARKEHLNRQSANHAAESVLCARKLRTPRRVQSDGGNVRCLYRQASTSNRDASHATSVSRPFVCGVCNETLSSSRVLKRHHTVHLNIKPWRCELCDKLFTRKDHLKKHTDQIHYQFHSTTRAARERSSPKVDNTASLRGHQRGAQRAGENAEQAVVYGLETEVQVDALSVVPLPDQSPGQAADSTTTDGEVRTIQLAQMSEKTDSVVLRKLQIAVSDDHLNKGFNEVKNDNGLVSASSTETEQTRLEVAGLPLCDVDPSDFINLPETGVIVHGNEQSAFSHTIERTQRQLFHIEEPRDDETDQTEVSRRLRSSEVNERVSQHVDNSWRLTCRARRAKYSRRNQRGRLATSVSRPFVCGVCNAKLSRKHVLKRHLTVHLNTKPWRCEFCDKVFTRKDNLKTHTGIHFKTRAARVRSPPRVYNTASLRGHQRGVEQAVVHGLETEVQVDTKFVVSMPDQSPRRAADPKTTDGEIRTMQLAQMSERTASVVLLNVQDAVSDEYSNEGANEVENDDGMLSASSAETKHTRLELARLPLRQVDPLDFINQKTDLIVHGNERSVLSQTNERTQRQLLRIEERMDNKTDQTEVETSRRFMSREVDKRVSLHVDNRPLTSRARRAKYSRRNQRGRLSYARHTVEKTLVRRFVCVVCRAAFSRKDSLSVHRRVVHASRETFACNLCTRKYLLRSSLVRHVKFHAASKYVVCNVCGLAFTDRAHLSLHMRTHADAKFPASREIPERNTGRGESIKCALCDEAFSTNHARDCHIKENHAGEKFILIYTVSGQKRHVVEHARKRNERVVKSFACELCNAVCSRESSLRRHLKRHAGEKLSGCKDCEFSFHIVCFPERRETTRAAEKPFACHQCDAVFTTEEMLVDHTRSHVSQQMHERNELCEKFFEKQNENLEARTGEKRGTTARTQSVAVRRFVRDRANNRRINALMASDTSKSALKCKLCEEKFTNKTMFNRHVGIRNGERLFACRLCNASSAHTHRMRYLIRTTPGEKPFPCQFCRKSFLLEATLEIHVKTHTSEKPFTCATCKVSFKHKHSLVIHLEKNTFDSCDLRSTLLE